MYIKGKSMLTLREETQQNVGLVYEILCEKFEK